MEATKRTIQQTGRFKRDLKRESRGLNREILSQEFVPIVRSLANDVPLDARYYDHSLGGNWKDYRDCHIRPDLVLIYRKFGDELLQLVRLGSHSELGV
jgi:mRNA interferase YafQ